jgi:hypothetical protein
MPYIRVSRAAHERSRSHSFSNYRDWRAFLAAVQAPAAYASVATALKAGHDWLTGRAWMADGGSERCSWPLVEPELASRKTLGV